jgi:hypothetical protein
MDVLRELLRSIRTDSTAQVFPNRSLTYRSLICDHMRLDENDQFLAFGVVSVISEELS